jgi:hypothetical protein
VFIDAEISVLCTNCATRVLTIVVMLRRQNDPDVFLRRAPDEIYSSICF